MILSISLVPTTRPASCTWTGNGVSNEIQPQEGVALGAPPTPGAEPIAARDAALERVSRALRWCHAHDPGAVGPLVAFAAWHLDHEQSLLRTGMYRR